MSRVSSLSNLNSASSEKQQEPHSDRGTRAREVFRWTDLQTITQNIYAKTPHKASKLLETPRHAPPTVLAANGLLCIGTADGRVAVYDFKQSLICICASNVAGTSLGAVTALALSHDHTFIASGHINGYIQLYNLKYPHSAVRSVPPTTLAAVSSGRKEGHIQGSKIVSIGFVAGRHTAIVSADDNGLAFFHSLGKVLFVEASDILRILGRYPETPSTPALSKTPLASSVPVFSPGVSQRRKTRYTVLAMAPLPLGTAPHATDNYHVVALLTATKLVVVGLKPTPRTWFKCAREVNEGGSWKSNSRWIGSLAWFPSVLRSSGTENGRIENSQPQNDVPTDPMLAYTWGSSFHLIKVKESKIKQTVKNSKTGKISEVEVGTVAYEHFRTWVSDADILAVQWLNANQIIIISRGNLGVYDLKLSKLVEQVPFDGLSLAAPTTSEDPTEGDNDHVAHSVRAYKGKLFLLKRDRISVGSLLTWADRILSLVQDGDFLEAIDLTRSYYTDEAPGNRNNLPDDPIHRKDTIGDKLRSLMQASTQYAFSDDRMADGTHTSPGNRGVDRTSLFEGLVTVCCKACVALDDFEFLFEDLFQRYDDSGIAPIYLRQLEPFALNDQIRYLPPRITQRLVALHQQDGRPEHVERIIWHMDPSCLDLNQAIHLCQEYHLYDALIYIYSRAMRDYVAPVVELLGLIRSVRQFRRMQLESIKMFGTAPEPDSSTESMIINAYKIYPYLANILSGLTYPSEEPLSVEEAFQAKRDVYTFLFFGRSSVWPPGEEGKLVLTSDEEGGSEPTYPYARQLLLFDSESFLHSLDIAFEDAYLNDETQTINRLIIVRILLEIMSSGTLRQEDITFVHIFIARNVPKYPQFLQIAPTVLHNIIIGLAEDPDPKTREDRQLAAEYLLSVYNPHESERIIALFEHAGFFRILRAWYLHEHQWAHLLVTYVDDPDMSSLDILGKIEEVVVASSRANKGVIPNDLIDIISKALPRLLQADIAGAAFLIDRLLPSLHTQAIEALGDDGSAESSRYDYLHNLLGPPSNDEEYQGSRLRTGPSKNLPQRLRHMFFDLQCQFHPEDVISTLQYLQKDTLDMEDVLETCEAKGVFDAVVWATDWQGDPQGALGKADIFQKRISCRILDDLAAHSHLPVNSRDLGSLQAIAKISRDICLKRSQGSSVQDVPLEDMWFQLLNSQINSVQVISASIPTNEREGDNDSEFDVMEVENMLSALRSLVQATFSALVSVTSTSAVSFPRLFKRLVNSAPSSTGSHYTEFRIILTGMLESYRSDEDLLNMLKNLVDRDLFDTVAEVMRERACGWTPSRGTCQYCRNPLVQAKDISSGLQPALDLRNGPLFQIVVSRTGSIYHRHCRPSDPSELES
ncbi:vacuolar protein sorting-associated protein [Crassisporium funariophilum]|nr:vacuolar protein sorting-associated protein [Crassisporium funariophilum]